MVLGVFAFENGLTLEPGIGLTYDQIHFNNFRDKFGKDADYDILKHTEVGISARLEKNWDNNAKLYIKPGIIQTTPRFRNDHS